MNDKFIGRLTDFITNEINIIDYHYKIKQPLIFRNFKIDYYKRIVILKEKMIALNKLVFDTLYYLTSYPEHIFS